MRLISSRFSEKLHDVTALRELKKTEIKVDDYQLCQKMSKYPKGSQLPLDAQVGI